MRRQVARSGWLRRTDRHRQEVEQKVRRLWCERLSLGETDRLVDINKMIFLVIKERLTQGKNTKDRQGLRVTDVYDGLDGGMGRQWSGRCDKDKERQRIFWGLDSMSKGR